MKTLMTGVNVFLHVFEPMEHFLLDGFLDVLELMHDLTYDGTCFVWNHPQKHSSFTLGRKCL